MEKDKIKYLPTDYQNYIALSRYAKWQEESSRRENWAETVDRYINFFKQRTGQLPIPYNDLRNAILNLDVMPSMRCMMVAGKALDRDNVAGYNCSFTPIDGQGKEKKVFVEEIDDVVSFKLSRPNNFDEAMYILMCGTGIGFSVERQYINNLPTVGNRLSRRLYTRNNTNFPGVSRDELSNFDRQSNTIIVHDSKYGWASAYRILVVELYNGNFSVDWDLSNIRPAGAILKTFGGRSSGPEPLNELMAFTKEIFKGANGRKLNSLECHDLMCKIGDAIVVGGVRRSAEISLSNLSDDRMRNAKNGNWWEAHPYRRLANNSVTYTEKPDNVGIFMREWGSLYESRSGERGIFNRVACQKQAAKNGRRESDHDFGTNPCLHPDSMVETVHGRVKIKDITEPTQVYSMDRDGKLVIKPCSASWISKKNVDTLNITIASGKVVRCTPDHKIYIDGRGWVEAQDIRVGDRVVHLVRNRRGAAYSGVKLTTQGNRDFVMEHRLVWESVNGPVPDGYDIHHIDGDTYNNDVDNLECLTHADHSSLTRYECDNDHMVTGYRDHSPGRHGSMFGFVSQGGSKPKKIVPMPDELKSGLHQYPTVIKIEEGEKTDVYDLTVEDTHNFIADFVVVHNCSEIILRPKQFCNLSEIVARPGDSIEDLGRKAELATILGTLQSTLTDFVYLSEDWRTNTEEERLLGVSITGIMDHPVLSGKTPYFNSGEGKAPKNLASVLNDLKEITVETNKRYAALLGINQSAACTCVKPSGTVSQLVDSASGIHPRYAQYYIRRVGGDEKDPITQFMKDSGVPYEVNIRNPHELLFMFPIESPDTAVVRTEVSALEQLDLWKIYQDYWCEHKPSITVYVRPDEWLDVQAWVWHHFDEISGISFLPYDDHVYQQAPYEEITEEQYNELMEKMPTNIDWSKLADYEKEDNTTASFELACTGGSCEI